MLPRLRSLLESKKLGEALSPRVNEELKRRGYEARAGTIVDAEIIGDGSSYQHHKEPIASNAPRAQDFTNERTRRKGWVDEEAKRKNRTKVEHAFEVVKRQWGFTKVTTVAWRGRAARVRRLRWRTCI